MFTLAKLIQQGQDENRKYYMLYFEEETKRKKYLMIRQFSRIWKKSLISCGWSIPASLPRSAKEKNQGQNLLFCPFEFLYSIFLVCLALQLN